MPAKLPDEELVFRRPDSAGTLAVVWFLAGLAASGIAVIGFVVSILRRVDALQMHLMTTLPTLGAIAAFTRAWAFVSTPREIVADPDGLSILGQKGGDQDFGWEQIGWSKIATLPMTNRRRLVLFDARGKVLAKIDEGMGDFDRLKDYVQKKLDGRGGPAGAKIRTSKNRRSALFIGSVFGFFFLLCVVLAVMTRYEQLETAGLQERGVQGDAAIVRRFLAPNGVTPWLEYRVDTPDGRAGTRNAAMFRRQWDALAGQATVPVVYDPDNPANSQLLEGEDREGNVAENASSTYLLCAGMSIFCLGGVAYAVFRWKGLRWEMSDMGIPSLVRSGDAG